MAATPKYKIFRADGEYAAACKYAEDAAALVAIFGPGATIKIGHIRVVWREGHETVSAGESYDAAAATITEREAKHDDQRAKAHSRLAGRSSATDTDDCGSPMMED